MFLAIILADYALGQLTSTLRQTRHEVDILLALVDLAIIMAISLWPGTPGSTRFGPP